MSRHGNIQKFYTKNGLRRFAIEIWHDDLNKYQVIRGDNQYVVQQKANAKMSQWDDMWERKKASEEARKEREKLALDKKQKLELAAEKTKEIEEHIQSLNQILIHTLDIDDAVDWESLKNRSDYPNPKPKEPTIPKKPLITDKKYQPDLNIFDHIVNSWKQKKLDFAKQVFEADILKWEEQKTELDTRFEEELAKWTKAREEYIKERDKNNLIIDEKRELYIKGETEAVLDYYDIVLSNSQYPDYFPQSYEMDYNPEGKFLIIDYELPNLESIPKIKEIKYIQSRDEFSEKFISQTQLNRIYDQIIYQIALRTLHEIFEADKINAITFVVFNGYVNSIDPATGQEKTACIISIQANQEEFETINLANVEPKACFKNLKGVGSSKLYSLTPIAPIISIDKEDKRFVDSYEVVNGLGADDNLAAMDWEDFEHLIREVFEKEFASNGGEVKVTQASRDGGIDAVAFDPDPIRGGKIVIQAKRYTNTVGVSAVRDLFGSLMNEGATKGILVTTSDYGPDAYSFAKGKPITLLNGNNLLHLLEKHGHRAKIDLQEAKRLLADKD